MASLSNNRNLPKQPGSDPLASLWKQNEARRKMLEGLDLSKTPDFGLTRPQQQMQSAASKSFADYMQQYMNQQVQQQQAAYMAQLNQIQSANKRISFTRYAPSMPVSLPNNSNRPQNMTPPKYEPGDHVVVGGYSDDWIIDHIDTQYGTSGNSVHVYYLYTEDEDGDRDNEHRCMENDIKSVRKDPNKTVVDFDTVVLEAGKRKQIEQALEQINQADLIFDTWGFSETIEKGRGVSMLFWGPPGTGKTLMAQAIANKLGKKLVVISSADIESSVPGEAERNIRKHFKKAHDGKTIILFDECDSLIYTRQHVGAIMSAQINELLSQIERFDGITLFTTNRLGTLDEAVNRRLALKLEFAMPSVAERVEIWKRMFPKKAPLHKDVDFSVLAEVELTGGYIKNAVLRAARMAATEPIANSKKKIKMTHLAQATRQELTSMAEFDAARQEHNGQYGSVSGGIVKTRERGGITRG